LVSPVDGIPQKEHGDYLIGRKPGTSEKGILFFGHVDAVCHTGSASCRSFRMEAG